MTAQEITNILLGLLAASVPAATFLYSSRSSRIQAKSDATRAAIEEKSADSLAYENAAKLYRELIDSLRIQYDRLEESNRRLESEVSTLRESNGNLVDEVSRLRAEIATLKPRAVQ